MIDERPPRLTIDAEMAALGCMLVESQATRRGIEMLTPEDFYLEDHRLIFKAAGKVYTRDRAVDVVTLAEELRAQGKAEDLNLKGEGERGAMYLTTLINKVVTAAHIDYYAKLVKESALDRALDAQIRVTADKKTPDNIKKLHELMDAMHGVRHDRIFDFRKDLAAAIDDIINSKSETIDTGFVSLDAALGGLDVGDVTTIGARTSGGKTAFMVKMCVQIAERKEYECLYLTTEMTEAQVVARVLPMASGVPAWKFRRKNFQKTDITNIMDVSGDRLSKLPIKVYGRSRLTIQDIRAAVAQAKPRIVFIDYLQRIELAKGDNRAYQIMDFMIALKSLAQEQRVNIVIGCQLDRKLDKTAPEPENADLKDSGAIEAESDQVVLLWKPSPKDLAKDPAYKPPPDGHHLIRAKVSKNRHGAAWGRADFILNGPLVDMSESIVEAAAEQDRRLPKEELWTAQPKSHYD